MSKQAQLPDGTTLDFPDETPDDVMDRVVKQHLGQSPSLSADMLAQRQAASKAAFESANALANPITNPPGLAKPGEILSTGEKAKRLGLALLNTGKKPYEEGDTLGSESPQSKPLVDLSEHPYVNTGVGLLRSAFEAGVPAGGAVNALPSTARAGQNFQMLKAAVGDLPIAKPDIENLANVVGRVKQLNATGGGAPAVATKLAKVLDKPTAMVAAGQPYIPFDNPNFLTSGRDFAQSAGRLSASERLAANGPMRAQVAKLADALDTANRNVAESKGLGGLYDSAMSEYRNAMRLKEGLATALKWGTRAAIGGTGYALGKELGIF